jgi:hypothetical protein
MKPRFRVVALAIRGNNLRRPRYPGRNQNRDPKSGRLPHIVPPHSHERVLMNSSTRNPHESFYFFGTHWEGGELMSKFGAARRKCHLAQIMHKLSPWPAPRCVVSAHLARFGAPPARIARRSMRHRASVCNLMTSNGLQRNYRWKSRFVNKSPADGLEANGQSEVACEKPVMTIRSLVRPSARVTLGIRSIDIHLWSNDRGPTLPIMPVGFVKTRPNLPGRPPKAGR